ncbi:MAG: protein jag [Clostridia bacterium]|nr:protein jag [Clostridia bacterium]
MRKELIITAKTVDEAKAEALRQLGLPEEEVEFTVLEEGKKGFLGIGAADAKVSASYAIKGSDLALEFIKKIAADMELDLVIKAKPGNNDDTVITVEGEGAGLLIGHHGETLDSLQYLANLVANKKTKGEKREYTRITLDIENYRNKREDALRALARRMANKVLKGKRSVMLEPMNPYERRIIHSEVQSIEGVSTNSIGADDNRRVVIFLEEDVTVEEESFFEDFAAEDQQ